MTTLHEHIKSKLMELIETVDKYPTSLTESIVQRFITDNILVAEHKYEVDKTILKCKYFTDEQITRNAIFNLRDVLFTDEPLVHKTKPIDYPLSKSFPHSCAIFKVK